MSPETNRHVFLTENTSSEGETGAGIMRNRCAFTSRDMAADWPEAFTYAIVTGWDTDSADLMEGEEDGAMEDVAAKFGWDPELVEFLRDAHERFKLLADKRPAPPEAIPERDLTAPRWNIGFRIFPLDEWKMWWHNGSTGHRTEAEAREEFYGLLLDPYWLAARDLRLIDADGNVVDEHIRP